MFTTQELEDILSGNYSIEFAHIKIFKRTNEIDICYEGPGSINVEQSGLLTLKMYYIFSDKKDPFSIYANNLQAVMDHAGPGQILPEDYFYTFECIDMSGKTWETSGFSINPSISIPSAGFIIKTNIRSIWCAENQSHPDTLSAPDLQNIRVFIKGKYDLPWNSYIQTGSPISLAECKLTIGSHECSIRNVEDKYIHITKHFHPEDQQGYKLLLEAFSIATGKSFRPVIIISKDKNKTVTQIFSNSQTESRKELFSPISLNFLDQSESFSKFVNAYYSKIKEPQSVLYNFWWRVLESKTSSSIENICLILTVAIEGMCKEYFSHLGSNAIAQNDVEEAIKQIRSLNINTRLFDRINGMLTSSNTASPRAILKNLSEQNIISKEMREAWISLRNSSAHGDTLTPEDINNTSMQEIINKMHSCLALFYQLIFEHIEYYGSYTDYSLVNWPKKNERELPKLNKLQIAD